MSYVDDTNMYICNFLININDILSIWTIKYDIFSIPDIENLCLCNINKYNFIHMTYGQNVYIRYGRKYLCLYCIWKLFLYILWRKFSLWYKDTLYVCNIDKAFFSSPNKDIVFFYTTCGKIFFMV